MTRSQRIVKAYRLSERDGFSLKESAEMCGIISVEISDLTFLKTYSGEAYFNAILKSVEEEGYFFLGSKKYRSVTAISRKLRKASNSLDGLIFSKEEKDLLEPILSRLNDIFDISPKLLPAMILILQSKDLKRKVRK